MAVQVIDKGTIRGRRGKALHLGKGQALKLINTHGHQVVDTWAFNPDDVREYLSLEHTRPIIGKIYAEKGDTLYTNKRRPILFMEEDTSNEKHDTLIAACDIYRYNLLGCKDYHDNCTDNLRAAMRQIGIDEVECPSPLNLWMCIPITPNGEVVWAQPSLKEGDYIVLRAAMDCIVAMSCCPQDMVDIHGKGAKPTDVSYETLS
ncbi:MAG: urea carboxylase-associated family protein [Candidimonas sp.]|nr:MAG: urea carboxylase-associated family protein [Candidimonas sp.]TAM24071.1 MAG: urea carboxylase-associated family protein [Candidimonas sp.]TAM80338.1 MAG: urea carboxylase-associated family protein [Candidimonas sp.]